MHALYGKQVLISFGGRPKRVQMGFGSIQVLNIWWRVLGIAKTYALSLLVGLYTSDIKVQCLGKSLLTVHL